MSINYPELLRKIAGELDERGQFGSSRICRESADFFERLNVENTDLAAENAALRAEVERLTPREMTVAEICEAFNRNESRIGWWEEDEHGIALVHKLGPGMKEVLARVDLRFARYIAQGLERNAKGGG